MKMLVLLTLFQAVSATAQTTEPKEFPADSAPISAEALKTKISGKVYSVSRADGSSWRLDYRSNGYFYVNTSGGFNGSGPWRTEDGRLCTQGRNLTTSCNEVREKGDALFLKRDNGEVIHLTPR